MAELEAGLAVIDETGNLNLVLYYDALLATIAIHRGDLATAQARLTAGIQHFTDGASHFGADWLFGAQAEFLAATGQLDAALTIAEANLGPDARTSATASAIAAAASSSSASPSPPAATSSPAP